MQEDQLRVEVTVPGVDFTGKYRVRDAYVIARVGDAIAIDFVVGVCSSSEAQHRFTGRFERELLIYLTAFD